jgi:hypothetical protein
MTLKKKIGELLMAQGVLDEANLKKALGHQIRWGGKLGQVLIEMGAVPPNAVAQALATQANVPYGEIPATLSDTTVKRLPAEVAQKLKAVVIGIEGTSPNETFVVAIGDPWSGDTQNGLRARLGRLRFVVAAEEAIEHVIRRVYLGEAASDDGRGKMDGSLEGADAGSLEIVPDRVGGFVEDGPASPAEKLDLLFDDAEPAPAQPLPPITRIPTPAPTRGAPPTVSRLAASDSAAGLQIPAPPQRPPPTPISIPTPAPPARIPTPAPQTASPPSSVPSPSLPPAAVRIPTPAPLAAQSAGGARPVGSTEPLKWNTAAIDEAVGDAQVAPPPSDALDLPDEDVDLSDTGAPEFSPSVVAPEENVLELGAESVVDPSEAGTDLLASVTGEAAAAAADIDMALGLEEATVQVSPELMTGGATRQVEAALPNFMSPSIGAPDAESNVDVSDVPMETPASVESLTSAGAIDAAIDLTEDRPEATAEAVARRGIAALLAGEPLPPEAAAHAEYLFTAVLRILHKRGVITEAELLDELLRPR